MPTLNSSKPLMSVIGAVLDEDPYLAYQPAFAYTLPIQLFVNGITITLLAVLLMHLLFTTQYHYPLAPLNYSLQLSSVLVVMISVLIKISYILHHSSANGDQWPYDLDYVAVSIPPESWTTAQNAAWFLLQALNNGLANITHIQFLTLLYPSRTEARLIIFVLGPLALVSSGLVFTALSGSQKVLDISDSIRNVFNSTLLLIFTIALLIWGFFVNRRRAWRTDGGTAAFGFGAMFLAVVSTTFNFVAVAEDGIDWLQHLLFAAVLWQTWLGWWWWVGSGMGIGEVEDLMERAEKKKRKNARKAARQRADKRQPRNRATSLAGIVDAGHASANAMIGFTSSVAGILRNRKSTLVRRDTQRDESGNVDDEEQGAIEMGSIRQPSQAAQSGRVGFSGTTPPGSRNNQQSTNSETSSTSATPSLHVPHTLGQLLSFPTTWLQVYLRRLRRAHEDAARTAAMQRVERRQAVFDHRSRDLSAFERNVDERSPREGLALDAARAEAAIVEGEGVGWGLGSFGIKEHRETARRLRAARERLQEDRLLGSTVEDASAEEPAQTPEAGGSSHDEPNQDQDPSTQAGPSRPTERRPEEEGEWEDLDETSSSSDAKSRARKRKKDKGQGKWRAKKDESNDEEGGQGGRRGGWSWWGPLKDWRLSDRSVF